MKVVTTQHMIRYKDKLSSSFEMYKVIQLYNYTIINAEY